MCYFSVILSFINIVYAVTSQCSVIEIKSLLEGCDRLTGLNITSVGGTIVNDHNCDVFLPKQVFLEEPLFQYNSADSKKIYTIIMVNPDAFPQVEGEFFLHMLKSNIPGLALKAKESSKTVGIDYRVVTSAVVLLELWHYMDSGDHIPLDEHSFGYKPPAPPRGTGVHRFISLLYEQADGNNFLPTVPGSRNRFVLAKWLIGKNLCGPVAGTQFKSEF